MRSFKEYRRSNPATVCLTALFAVFSFGFSTPQACAQYGNLQAPPESIRAGFESITEQSCEEVLTILAGPVFEGRGTGQLGYMKAAHWVAGKAAEYGLEPMGEGETYFQMLPMQRRVPDPAGCRIVCADNSIITLEGNFGLERFTDQFEVSGQGMFLSIAGADATITDRAQLRDKVVIYTVDEAALPQAARMIARCRPAAAFRVTDTEPMTSSQILREGARTRSTSVSGTITRVAAEQIARGSGGDATWTARPQGGGVSVVPANGIVSVQVQTRDQPARVPNVVAWLEGSDPELKHEYIVLGAHLDHLGLRSGQVFPGADDNGSGSTAVLNIARALAANPVKPRRSVLFMWFAAEEIGLIGSRHYCDHPLLPLENMTCMLNIDMVGRNESSDSETDAENEGHIHLVGSQKGESRLHGLILEANNYIGFEFEFDEEDVFGRSDQINFYEQGVPVAFLFGGFHPDYHRPTDTIEQINFHKVSSAARLYYTAVFMAAEYGRFEMNGDQKK